MLTGLRSGARSVPAYWPACLPVFLHAFSHALSHAFSHAAVAPLGGIFRALLPRCFPPWRVTARHVERPRLMPCPTLPGSQRQPRPAWRHALLALACMVCVAPAALAQAAPATAGTVPSSASSASSALHGELWDYRVNRGDTLIGLQARLLRPQADWRVLQRLNHIKDPRRLQPGSILRIPLALLREEPVSAEVLHAHGDVFVERGGAARDPLAATAALRAGDIISTGAQSSVSVRFADGSRALLGPGGRLRLERHVRLGASGVLETRLYLEIGALETRVQPARPSQPAPRFELRTPVANLGVRGTDFRARIGGEITRAEVLEGRVSVGTVALDAGFGTLASPAGVAPPRVLPPTPDLATMPTRVERVPLQFSFPAVAGALAYRAQLFDTQVPQKMLLEAVFEQASVAWPDHPLGSPPDGRYELRLRAADESGLEGRAATLAFTLKARPEPPFQLRPRGDEKLFDETVVFAWSAHPEAARYRLQVAAQSDFKQVLLDNDTLTATTFSAPLPLGTWYWRLATVRAGGDSGPWGDAAVLLRAERPPPPPAPPLEAPKATDAGLVMRWAATPLPGVRYQVQVARDVAFTQLVLDETTAATERLLPKPEPGAYHLRVRSVGSDGRAGTFGAAQVVDIPASSRWWLWLLPLLLWL